METNAEMQISLSIAGLNVVRIINEPTAAAIAYGLDKTDDEKNILVFHLGGGTFDVSILTISDGVVLLIKKKHGKDIRKDKQSLIKLRREAERAKRTLSNSQQVHVETESLFDAVDFSESLTRVRFEYRIPRVQQVLKYYFYDQYKLNKAWDPDEAVALGAAVKGGIMSREGADDTIYIRLLDVAPLTLGIETIGGVMMELILRNTVIPTKRSQAYEGEISHSKDCRLLGTFDLSKIPLAPRGTAQIDVTFEVDANGILNVKAEDTTFDKQENITITIKKGRLSLREIECMVWEAEDYAEDDKKVKEKIDAHNALEGLEWVGDNQSAEKEEFDEKLKEPQGFK
nr:hypothetical protein [Tanacetum cinerariifolium]